MANFIQGMGTLAMFLTTLGFFCFCLLFHVLADWRSSEMGRHMMVFMLVCTTILTYAFVLTLFTGPLLPLDPVRATVRLVMYSCLCLVVWWRVRILVTVQIAAREERDTLRLPTKER